ncbi:putative receptor-like protein kinase [Cucumis melo var. makuwa]|uniref:non-specific serine/threonine protein kinase n=2 Tax=Cucumis melo TaxID=3656 RepID=A0A5D3BV62_CUCMM|nr:putative receptor-like protein kinase [Cucumis melo var. makuwa]
MAPDLNTTLSKKTFVFGMKVWVFTGILVGVFIVIVLVVLSICVVTSRRKSRRVSGMLPLNRISIASKEIKEIGVDHVSAIQHGSIPHDGFDTESEKVLLYSNKAYNYSISSSVDNTEIYAIGSGEGSKEASVLHRPSDSIPPDPSPLAGLPEFSQLGWGHWFTLRDLELATMQFANDNIIGEGGYGVVYRGHLINGTPVAVKKLLNVGQAEREFKVEVEAFGHVRHKNLVRLLGYCIEGTHRMLVYEYVDNGNLEQWLHGALCHHGYLTWEARIKILLGTAKALAYLHEAIEPKIVHRDIKASNILIDDEFNAKLSDFGLAKLLGSGKSHITTRVMGTFGYVAPEYAKSGLLNEKSDVYSFGVVLLEAITGRDPVDYGRPTHEVNLVDWLKMMVGSKRSEEVVDPNIERKPSISELKRVLLTALRCVDPDADKRPKMSQVSRMLESEEYPIRRQDRRPRKGHATATKKEAEKQERGPRRHR